MAAVCCAACTCYGSYAAEPLGDGANFPGIDKIKKRFSELFPDATLEKGQDAAAAKKRKLTQKEIDGLKKSAADLRLIIEKYPKETAWCAKTQNQIGETYRDIGDYDTAIAEYEKVLTGYPGEKGACADAQQGIEACRRLAQEPEVEPVAPEQSPAAEDAAKGA
ncbi:MAG TPA: tetratricopeptide repeat protein, partial [bacterium]|nr:tetratricopeptide repeat protein [bacterium]